MKNLKIILLPVTILIIIFLIIVNIPESRKEIKTQHFTFLYSSSIDKAKIAELSNALESNYLRIGNDLKTTPASNIKVNIYAQSGDI